MKNVPAGAQRPQGIQGLTGQPGPMGAAGSAGEDPAEAQGVGPMDKGNLVGRVATTLTS